MGYGAHVNGFVLDDEVHMKYWVGTRARTKPTWPGLRDHLVAGQICGSLTPDEVVIKVCYEACTLRCSCLSRRRARKQEYQRSWQPQPPLVRWFHMMELMKEYGFLEIISSLDHNCREDSRMMLSFVLTYNCPQISCLRSSTARSALWVRVPSLDPLSIG